MRKKSRIGKIAMNKIGDSATRVLTAGAGAIASKLGSNYIPEDFADYKPVIDGAKIVLGAAAEYFAPNGLTGAAVSGFGAGIAAEGALALQEQYLPFDGSGSNAQSVENEAAVKGIGQMMSALGAINNRMRLIESKINTSGLSGNAGTPGVSYHTAVMPTA